MPTIKKCVSNLISNIYIGEDQRWFSNLYDINLYQDRCVILAPTVNRCIYTWNLFDQQHEFVCNGDDIESCKQSLCDNVFPLVSESLATDNIFEYMKNVTWVRMIIALNMYAGVRRYFRLEPYGNVDIVLASGSSRYNYHRYKIHYSAYNVYKVLYIEDCKLSHLIALNFLEKTTEFWRCIFEIYDDQLCDRENTNIPLVRYPDIENTPTMEEVPISAITKEYLNRDKDVEYVVPSSKQIAEMIAQIDNLPLEVRKSIYDTCVTFYISHSFIKE